MGLIQQPCKQCLVSPHGPHPPRDVVTLPLRLPAPLPRREHLEKEPESRSTLTHVLRGPLWAVHCQGGARPGLASSMINEERGHTIKQGCPGFQLAPWVRSSTLTVHR